MAVTDAAAMRMMAELGRLHPMLASSTIASVGNVTAKLMRAFSGQVEALAKLRRPADQVIRVERVNVEPGGQALIGNMNYPGSGRGVTKTEDQPYGTADPRTDEPAPDTALWREEAGWNTMPEATREGPDPLSSARRRTRQRRSQG